MNEKSKSRKKLWQHIDETVAEAIFLSYQHPFSQKHSPKLYFWALN